MFYYAIELAGRILFIISFRGAKIDNSQDEFLILGRPIEEKANIKKIYVNNLEFPNE